jgi:capsid assembly protease
MKMISLQRKLDFSVWYLDSGSLKSFRESIESLPPIVSGNIEDVLGSLLNQRPPMVIDRNGIATVSVSGVLARDCSPVEKLLGLTSYDDITSDINEAVEAGAKAVLFDMDSPGGEAQGTEECAQAVASIAVPTASFTSGMDCSAAYYLSSGVDRKFVTPSSFTGSIGAVLPYINKDGLWSTMGLSWEPIIGDGDTHKAAGMGPSLTGDQRAHLQEQVNVMSGAFRDHVSNFRDVPFKKLKGAAFLGQKAVDLNLADRIGSYDQAYAYLLRKV